MRKNGCAMKHRWQESDDSAILFNSCGLFMDDDHAGTNLSLAKASVPQTPCPPF